MTQVFDINGGELRQGSNGQLLVEILEITDEHVHVRILNSNLDAFVGVRRDEVLGGMVADSELVAFNPPAPPEKPDEHVAQTFE